MYKTNPICEWYEDRQLDNCQPLFNYHDVQVYTYSINNTTKFDAIKCV